MRVDAELVDPGMWRSRARDMSGWRLDFLTAIDRAEEIEVVAHYVRGVEHAWVATHVAPGGSLASIADLHPAAAWPERETAEMFGVTLGDTTPLLRHEDSSAPPLRKATPLPARVHTPWPGAAEPDDDGRQGANPSRRRMRSPGVQPEWES